MRQLAGRVLLVAAYCWALAWAAPAAAVAFTYQNSGIVGPSVFLPLPPGSPLVTPRPCPPPPALPIDCDLTALGNASVVSGDAFGPWGFASVFSIAPSFAVTGWFGFFDSTAAQDSFFGTLSGRFDPVVFQSAFDYVLTSGTGAFSGARGTGSGLVQVLPGATGFAYTERGTFTVPEPGSLALLASALLGLAVVRRTRRR